MPWVRQEFISALPASRQKHQICFISNNISFDLVFKIRVKRYKMQIQHFD